MNRTFSSSARDDRGAVLVEFALVATLLILIVCAIFTFGVAWSTKTQVAGFARDGARAASLRQSAPTLPSGMTMTSGSCAVGDTTSNVSVTVKKNVPLTIPFWPGSKPSQTISETVTMRCGG
jgi:hypothetical protein